MSIEFSGKDQEALRAEAEAMSRTLHDEPRQWGPFYASYVEAMGALGLHDRALGELETAAAALDVLQRGSPIHITALYRMAVIQHELQRRTALIDTLRRLLQADPSALPLVRPLLTDALAARLDEEVYAANASSKSCALAVTALLQGARQNVGDCDPVLITEAVSAYTFMRIEELSDQHVVYLVDQGFHPDFLKVVRQGHDAVIARTSPATGDKPWRADPKVSARVRDVLDTVSLGAKTALHPLTGETVVSRKMLADEVFLVRSVDEPVIVAQWAETDSVTADTFWILPAKSIVLYFGASRIGDQDARTRLSTLYVQMFAECGRGDFDIEADSDGVIIAQYPIPHIGHYVWNGISGWSSFFKYCPKDRLPHAIAYCGHLKVMADVTEIYPEACEAIGTILVSQSEAEHAALPRTRNSMMLTLKDNFVTEGLARRMLTWAGKNVSTEFLERIESFRSRCYPMLLVNIRLDNRAWVQQREGFLEIFRALQRNHPAIGFVIDGINSGVTQGWTHADMSVDREMELARALVEESAGIPIYNSIGCTVTESLVIADLSDGFISHVGAGMAKYRWIANLPGVAFSNEVFSTPGHRDGRLYDHYREGARQAIHVPQAAIKDDTSPGGPVGLKANFSMDWRSLHQAAEEFLFDIKN